MEKALFKEEKLNIISLIKTHELLSNALVFKNQIEKRIENNPEEKKLNAIGKAAVIKSFKLVFNESIKIMRKYMEYEDGIDGFATYKCFFRTAEEKSLIDDFHKWMKFYKAKESVSEAPYTDETVNKVCLTAKEFDAYVKELILFLEK
ncbi:nucleotidyltransferase substrate binding protein [Methanobrevibacter filiformis]|uniref:Nucleotidyltransferase substrate binding protein like protein n=1 Tax=Methanobrevibacter filiformis TaxID=55758 RepID=A0A166EZW0_9EURY|nr:nucleotidyltransferase substrate binding protein [Methanobrevibacter filiformis]KZX17180.1 nucleotidyltransferase substrate binding protein like protein [Methanobrevibacter filiformis]